MSFNIRSLAQACGRVLNRARCRLSWHAGIVAAAGALLACGTAFGQSFTTLYSFQGGTLDGSAPQDSVIQVGSSLYGMTLTGGTNGKGTLFQFNLSSGSETVLHSYGGVGDGTSPYDTPLQVGSILYATASAGGSTGFGAIVQYNLTTNTPGVSYSFKGQSGFGDGAYPYGSVVQSGTLLYGTTTAGGGLGGGALYSFSPGSGTDTILSQSFGDIPFPLSPSSAVTVIGSKIYGTAPIGGDDSRTGASAGGIFYGGNGWYDFQGAANPPNNDGATPYGAMTQVGSLLYGMTVNGSGGNSFLDYVNKGTIYEFNPANNTETPVYTFLGGSDGSNPYGALDVDGDTLYGMTSAGGASGDGTIFAFDLSTSIETVLHSFSGLDGSDPTGSLYLSGSTLYGMTDGGGTDGDGTIFSIVVPEPSCVGVMACAGIMAMRRRGSRVEP
jgi:uncharacterized repeat protein (TIGR03803 family)